MLSHKMLLDSVNFCLEGDPRVDGEDEEDPDQLPAQGRHERHCCLLISPLLQNILYRGQMNIIKNNSQNCLGKDYVAIVLPIFLATGTVAG